MQRGCFSCFYDDNFFVPDKTTFVECSCGFTSINTIRFA
jgi:hypothetical protein